ncbi:OLC1v1034608C10 [Oldenlandia corymbosa var. corymbosa]|uniref:RING-type E3 ubiquitin transferase n=1 Tax=Oldenlandia corymbosa var. corymbosa TaxID=529605 RepID=A0AAV1CRN6_OLDCO|nr:OLC1v1034608C10 [Oldenlandia corymbosa var. corymbosa]
MGHRHLFSSSQIFEDEHDQVWNHGDQPYMHLGRPNAAENASGVGYPSENVNNEDGSFTAQWNAVPSSTGYTASGINFDMPPRYQPLPAGPSRDPFPHPPAVGSINIAQDSYPHHASSSNQSAQAFNGPDGGFFELSMGTGGGLHKRKYPGGPAVSERGNTSWHYDAGSSSDHSSSAEAWLEKQNADSHHAPADFIPHYRGNGPFIGSEGSSRNVRIRSAFDLSSNPSHHSFAIQHVDHPGTVDLLGQSSGPSPMEWSHTYPSSASNGRNMISDASFLSHETNHYNVLNPVAPFEIGGYHNGFPSNRNPVSQTLHNTSSHHLRVRNGYNHRPVPPMRASSINLHGGNTVAPDEGLGMESYAPRNPRTFSTMGTRTGDRNSRSRISGDRYRSMSDHASFRDRPPPEGLVIMDRTAIYGSRNLFDHHREMRLDIDNMSYEELLALGERIGTVNTGLSEDLLVKSLMESIYCAADQEQDDAKCVICLVKISKYIFNSE